MISRVEFGEFTSERKIKIILSFPWEAVLAQGPHATGRRKIDDLYFAHVRCSIPQSLNKTKFFSSLNHSHLSATYNADTLLISLHNSLPGITPDRSHPDILSPKSPFCGTTDPILMAASISHDATNRPTSNSSTAPSRRASTVSARDRRLLKLQRLDDLRFSRPHVR